MAILPIYSPTFICNISHSSGIICHVHFKQGQEELLRHSANFQELTVQFINEGRNSTGEDRSKSAKHARTTLRISQQFAKEALDKMAAEIAPQARIDLDIDSRIPDRLVLSKVLIRDAITFAERALQDDVPVSEKAVLVRVSEKYSAVAEMAWPTKD